ncbi:hypothetical protein BCE02nite_52310 [Brevibacillus centrosporus]|nr:hypothetical protein BCE02nite_52310 [Brevibacillus centrosporus]
MNEPVGLEMAFHYVIPLLTGFFCWNHGLEGVGNLSILRLVKTKSGVVHVVSDSNSGKTYCGSKHNQIRTFSGKQTDLTCSKCQKAFAESAEIKA